MVVITRRRPGIPDEYGISTDESGMLDWEHVAQSLHDAHIFWVSTTTAANKPHLIPIWGAWVAEAAYIEGGDMTFWSRNLAERPDVHIGVDHDHLQVMVRGGGTKREVGADLQAAIADCYASKYDYRPEGNTFWEVPARRVLAWSTSRLDSFFSTPTEFVFEEPA